MPEIFYLGPEGTFSHILARKRFGKNAVLVPCGTIEGVVEATEKAPGSLGLIPVENSSGGTVYDSIDLLIKRAGHVFLQEELALNVRIALLGHSGRTIKTIYSHFTQIKHHTDWLKSLYSQARLRAVSSTAAAAQKAAASVQAAALASPGAAEVYGLDVLDQPKAAVNVTHFFVISGREGKPAGKLKKKTAFVALLPNVCGSLHSFLGPFARQKVSLTRIVSRPVPGQPQTYVFFIEIEGGEEDKPVAAALSRARPLAVALISLGGFPVGKRFNS